LNFGRTRDFVNKLTDLNKSSNCLTAPHRQSTLLWNITTSSHVPEHFSFVEQCLTAPPTVSSEQFCCEFVLYALYVMLYALYTCYIHCMWPGDNFSFDTPSQTFWLLFYRCTVNYLRGGGGLSMLTFALLLV